MERKGDVMNIRHLTSAILNAFFFASITSAETSKIAQTEVQLEPTGDTGENAEFGDACDETL